MAVGFVHRLNHVHVAFPITSCTSLCMLQVPRLCALVKRAIGLNTRTGCARFITALVIRQGADIKPHTAAFLKVPPMLVSCQSCVLKVLPPVA